MKAIEIKAGPELDQAVAKAIGWRQQCDWQDEGLADFYSKVYRCRNCNDVDLSDDGSGVNQECIPPYSTDLNAAFEAVEKAGLFTLDGPDTFLGRHPVAEWKVWVAIGEAKTTSDTSGLTFYEPTPALAICAAILKLKEET